MTVPDVPVPGSGFYFAAPTLGWTDPKNNSLWCDEYKTLFDPCPAGWRVPKSGEGGRSPWQSLTLDNSAWNPGDGYKGGRYLPGYPAERPAWIPAAGLRYYLKGMFQSVNTVGTQWPATRIGDQVFNFYFGSAYIDLKTPNYFPNGYPVRCVRE
ncbi:MAG: hypothetical protein LIO68_05300 [Rikenellaceae bacterium]|nr:hypothetical protein [Rikenellaceae bacterium]